MNLTGQYATSFQAILNKSVQTSEVPLTQIQNQDAEVLGQKAALGSLQTAVAALTSSLTALGNDGSTGALGATSSNTAVVTVTNSGATAPATYTVNSVTSLASAASETSLKGYTDSALTPVSSTGKMQLVVGSSTYNFTLTNNNLSGLVSQINGLNSGATASILTTAGGNYLSLSANSTGATTLQLNDDPTGVNKNIISNLNQGSNAQFQLNGINVSQASNTINNIVSGLTFNIVGKTSSAVTLTLASNPSQLSNDLQTFVSNYNSLATAVQAQSAGALAGNSIIRQLQQAMHQVTSQFSSTTGGVHSLADLGITFNGTNGAATFDPSVVAGMGSAQLGSALQYIGSTKTGLGGFSQNFTQFSDPITGLIQTQISSDTTSDSRLQTQITTTTAKINAMQQSLASQIEKADTLESNYESQQQTLNSSLQGLYLVLYGKSTGNVA
jgi:flagellar hook-associated protein 2